MVPELADKKKSISACTVAEDGKRISLATVMYNALSNPARCNGGLKGTTGRKSAKREQQAKIERRVYHVMHHGSSDIPADAPIPVENCKWRAIGFNGKKEEKHNGINSHYHFYICPELGDSQVMARRIPCSCISCSQQLAIPWNALIKEPLKQPRFQDPSDCHYKAILGNHNKWKLIRLVSTEVDDDELDALKEDILGEMEATIASKIEIGHFGAYDSDSDYYIVRWSDLPCRLEDYEDDASVEGCDRNTLSPGTIVCKGVYWNKVGRAKHWYSPPSVAAERLFRVRYVVATGFTMLAHSDSNPFSENRSSKSKSQCTDSAHNEIESEIARRARLDYDEATHISFGVDSESEGEDDAEDSGTDDDE